jgi:nucleoside-diphosphate-sugar epimerase
MNILITGSAGMVGKNLVDKLLSEGKHNLCPTYYEITIPKVDTKSIEEIFKNYIFLDIMNIESIDELLESFKPDIIIHLAAQSRPDISIKRPFDTFKTNTLGSINIANNNWVKKNLPWIINFSSSAVYGEIDWKLPANETSPTKPITSYGVSKLAAERYLHATYEGITTSLRLFNCSGPYKTSDLISDISKRLLIDGNNMLKIGALNKKRHYLHVSDVIDVVMKLINVDYKKRINFNREFNVAPTHKNLSDVLEVISCFEKIIGKNINLLADKNLFRTKDEEIIWGDSNLLSSLLKWHSNKNLLDIVDDSFSYAKDVY